MAQLKKLDVGHGYTADGGRTFPFRGKGVGLMPSLAEVLAAALLAYPPAQRVRLVVYGGDEPVAEVRARVPEVRTASRASLKACLLGYAALGWSGYVPPSCRRSMVLVPVNAAPFLWGWPNRLLRRMERAGSEVFVAGPYGGGFTTGIDTPGDLARLPRGYAGGIWTNEIEAVAGALAAAGR